MNLVPYEIRIPCDEWDRCIWVLASSFIPVQDLIHAARESGQAVPILELARLPDDYAGENETEFKLMGGDFILPRDNEAFQARLAIFEPSYIPDLT